jgi:hypothetical protein
MTDERGEDPNRPSSGRRPLEDKFVGTKEGQKGEKTINAAQVVLRKATEVWKDG